MKYVLKLEELCLLALFTFAYFHFIRGGWVLFVTMFFVPDLSFILILINKKTGALAYNLFHHKGVIILLLAAAYFLSNDTFEKIALIFLAHSAFDRVAGYGLKYTDNLNHTHLGWTGKNKSRNNEQ